MRYFPPLGSILILERMQTRFVDFLKTYKCSSYVLMQEVRPVLPDPWHRSSQPSEPLGRNPLTVTVPSVL